MKAVRPGNDNAALSDEELERVAQRTAEILEQRIAEIVFHKTMRRLARVALVAETVRPKSKDAPKIVPSAGAIERARIRRAKKGVF
jgi:hypothetical protein